MSLFDFPRMHVWGTQVVNVGTGNNDSASPGAELTVTSNSERVRAVTRGMTDAEFSRWMTGLDQDGLLRSQWNYYGDMSMRFIDVRVRSVHLDYDNLLTDPKDDPLIGAQVYLNNAVMCDTNPEGYHGTQIFAEALELRAPHALRGTGTFVSRKPQRATTRWLNWYRNVSYHGSFGLPPAGANGQLSSGGAGGASATFQCTVRVRLTDLAPAPHQGADNQEILHKFLPRSESRGAQALFDALHHHHAHGLIFRYNLYLTYPSISDTELVKQFARGLKTQNPAFGLILGTIAPWYAHEPETITMGRYLKPAAPFLNPYRPKTPYYLSPVVVRVKPEDQRISLDLANCLPEDGPDGEKFDMGPVTLGIRAMTSPGIDPAKNLAPIVTLGLIPNDKSTYLMLGGIYDLNYGTLPVEQQAVLEDDSQELVLQTGKGGVLLYEPEYMIASDCNCSYLDELPPGQTWDDPKVVEFLKHEPVRALRGEVKMLLCRRGKTPVGETTVTVEQWRETPTGVVNDYGRYRYPSLLNTETITITGGEAVYRLRPLDGPGLRLFRFVPPGLWPTVIDPKTLADLAFQEYFTELRVLPHDDYSKITSEQLTWEYIYDEIFRYYHLILPAMSVRLDMSDRTIWETPTAARYIKRVTDRRLWSYFTYMPRTRDLSRYRCELLWRFCDKVFADLGVPAGLTGPTTQV
jgi:hypothetical protein